MRGDSFARAVSRGLLERKKTGKGGSKIIVDDENKGRTHGICWSTEEENKMEMRRGTRKIE